MLKLINKFKSYEPLTDNYDKYENLIHERERYIRGQMDNIHNIFYGSRNLPLKFSKNLRDIKYQKLEKCKNKFEGQRLITDYYKPIKEKSSSILDSEDEPKINEWNDKIIELITELTSYNPSKCKNLDECVEKITIIIDIIYSFIENPNTMIYNKEKSARQHSNDIYNIIKNKIYKLSLRNYRIHFYDNDLKHPLYIKLKEEYKNILIALQKLKLDDCKEQEITGGKLNKKRKINNFYL